MPQSFRARLMTIVGASALALVLLTVTENWAAFRVEGQIELIQRRYMPKVQLGATLEAELERLARHFQDAVAAQDLSALEETDALKRTLLAQLQSVASAISADQLEKLRTAILDYDMAAQDVSRRLIAGESGDAILAAMSSMQAKQLHATSLLKSAMAFDRGELAAAFADVARAERDATRTGLFVSGTCLIVVILLSFWLTRGVLHSLAELGAGLDRFGRQEFGKPIEVDIRDEIGAIAAQANQMANSLARLREERDRADWLKAGHALLVHELRGDLEPREIADRASRVLADYLKAPAAALYYATKDERFCLLGHHAALLSSERDAIELSFRPGEGTIGAAAQQEQIVLIDAPPDYLRIRSALGESAPSTIALVPLIQLAKVTGVLELAFFRPWSDELSELLLSVRETLAISIEVARGRLALRELLTETQHQARRLAAQEDALRSSNEELQAQQEGLRRVNEELTKQTQVLEQRNAELAIAKRSIEQKAAELTTVSAYKTQFLANMSHELRTPLNSMLLLSNLLAENDAGNLTDKQVEFCRTIHGAGKDLLALINQVLDLAKIEAGKQQVELGDVLLAELVERVERVFGPLARDKGLELEVQLDPTLPSTVRTDQQRVQQILNNLLGNAIKFTEHGQVRLTIAPVASEVRLRRGEVGIERMFALSVSDTGVGIASEHQERIFAPFEQAESSGDRRYGGTGLGLSIARELAALLGGELQLVSEPGRGSTFTCYLPLAYPEASALVLQPTAATRAKRSIAPSGSVSKLARASSVVPNPRPDLLVIEDDPVFAEILANIIRAQGLTVSIAHDGLTGLSLARQCNPSGILLDVKLADIDGWTVMERLRAEPLTANIPVHFVSALEASERGMALGAVGYLTKPATRAQLTFVVELLAKKGAERACRVLIVEDDLTVVDSLVDLLRSERIAVHRTSSAREAFKALTTQRFDCMVLDLGLPDMDGLELLESLKQHLGSDILPVVVYTGRALSSEETRRLASYTAAVVLKVEASEQRVLDEIRGFTKTLKEGLQRPVLRTSFAPSQVRLEGRTILVADDDMRTVYSLSAQLRSKGAEVLVADTGVAALRVLAERPDVDSVLLDIMMPEMNGYDALANIRRDARFSELPVVVLTAKAMEHEQQRCIDAGATDYLTKPVDIDRLFQLLESYPFAEDAKPIRISHG